jgi:hypothetical protein
MSDFDSLAPEFNHQSSLTIYCAVRRPSSDFDAMVYPAGLIQFYGNPFEESLAESADGSLEQVLLFSDSGRNLKVLDDWRCEAKRAGAEVIRQGLTANQGFLHSGTVEWVLACTRILGDLKTDFIDQDKFDASKGLVTTLRNAWVESEKVFRKLAERSVPRVGAAGYESIANPCNPKGFQKPKRANTNVRMIEFLKKKPEAGDFTARQWAQALNVSPSTIHATETWIALQRVREQARNERMEQQSNKMNENPNGKKNLKKTNPAK